MGFESRVTRLIPVLLLRCEVVFSVVLNSKLGLRVTQISAGRGGVLDIRRNLKRRLRKTSTEQSKPQQCLRRRIRPHPD